MDSIIIFEKGKDRNCTREEYAHLSQRPLLTTPPPAAWDTPATPRPPLAGPLPEREEPTRTKEDFLLYEAPGRRGTCERELALPLRTELVEVLPLPKREVGREWE